MIATVAVIGTGTVSGGGAVIAGLLTVPVRILAVAQWRAAPAPAS